MSRPGCFLAFQGACHGKEAEVGEYRVFGQEVPVVVRVPVLTYLEYLTLINCPNVLWMIGIVWEMIYSDLEGVIPGP